LRQAQVSPHDVLPCAALVFTGSSDAANNVHTYLLDQMLMIQAGNSQDQAKTFG
jgi:hypothetical protein